MKRKILPICFFGAAILIIPPKTPKAPTLDAFHIDCIDEAPLKSAKKQIISDKWHNRPEVKKYIKKFRRTAKEEERLFGIPSEITLAQGLWESNAGNSKLSKKYNNHFGIKCFEKECKRNHCVNYWDDHAHDRFYIEKSAWYSYRHHSYFLQRPHYAFLFELDPGDYKGWAKGLKKAGYATDKRYPEILIEIIKYHQLNKI